MSNPAHGPRHRRRASPPALREFARGGPRGGPRARSHRRCSASGFRQRAVGKVLIAAVRRNQGNCAISAGVAPSGTRNVHGSVDPWDWATAGRAGGRCHRPVHRTCLCRGPVAPRCQVVVHIAGDLMEPALLSPIPFRTACLSSRKIPFSTAHQSSPPKSSAEKSAKNVDVSVWMSVPCSFIADRASSNAARSA